MKQLRLTPELREMIEEILAEDFAGIKNAQQALRDVLSAPVLRAEIREARDAQAE